MITIDNPAQSKRVLILRAGIRSLRIEADRAGAADLVHQLRNCVMTAQGALQLAEARLTQGRNDELDELLDLAERRMQEARALVARAQLARFPRRRPVLAAA